MDKNGLLHALLLDGKGGAIELDWLTLEQWRPEQGILWVHLDYTDSKSVEWISHKSGIDSLAAEALLTEETRPRTTLIDEAILAALRGVNLSAGSDPEDMVAIRLWVDPHLIISTRKRRLLSVQDIVDSLRNGKGPRTSGEFLIDLTERLIFRMEGTIEDIEDRVSEIEEEILFSESHALRNELSSLRREAIMLRRYLAPQREAMNKLFTEKISWLSENEKLRLREVTDRLIRYIEDLDSVRDRAAVTQEELVNRLSEQMNMRMYVLSLVAAIFLPLGFLTGLLGINVGGIPGAENSSAFLIFIFFLIVVVFVQILLFKKKRWL